MNNSLSTTAGGTSQALTIGTSSAASAAITAGSALVYATVDCFMRQGPTPVALINGTDQFVPGGMFLRVELGKGSTTKIAFIAAAPGTVYLTPGA